MEAGLLQTTDGLKFKGLQCQWQILFAVAMQEVGAECNFELGLLYDVIWGSDGLLCNFLNPHKPHVA